ncbi:CoA-binding protein [Massilia sp. CCM 8734]|uniref:CoA-binding protein n=1 Tax=Massilia sp. CCM 8734 TaxID=2609283 RepID=UPI00142097EF|nr:CoA-binding protein [Massilia sp. CCM 8734]NHZ96325.1 CoA-binding protein [Massilia sp. CCM 8734]
MRSIPTILKDSKTIAVVGLSNRPERASHAVAAYLQQHGYRILGVNPAYAGQEILGVPVYASLAQAAAALEDAALEDGARIDVVDCFRTPDAMLALAREAVDIGARCLWMQLGVVNQEAADLAVAAGLDVVMDRCMKIEHAHSGGAA